VQGGDIVDTSERIKARREELGMSQDELARAAGYKSRSSINKIEVDGRCIPQHKIVALAKALRVTPSYLMGWTDEKIYSEYSVTLDPAIDNKQMKELTKYAEMIESEERLDLLVRIAREFANVDNNEG
jgi:transcriptional regulator with XRE-family HTH domain